MPDIVVEEVKVPKSSLEQENLLGLSEADLSGHLPNKTR